MPIVSNTSPVPNLAIVDHLSLMHEQFGEILIPQAVFEELRVEEGSFLNDDGGSILFYDLHKSWEMMEINLTGIFGNYRAK